MRAPRLALHRRAARRRATAGFSLIELLVVILIVAEVLVAVSLLFDFNDRVTRVQTQAADLQQSMRVAQQEVLRHLRMAGRGNLPHGINPTAVASGSTPPLTGVGIDVRNNVGIDASSPSAEIAVGFGGSPRAVRGTDILIVRGCFEAPLFQVLPGGGSFTPDANGDGDRSDGRITIDNPGPAGICQRLSELGDDAVDRPLLVSSSSDDALFAVARITASSATGDLAADCINSPSSVTLGLDFEQLTNPYLVFSGNVYPPQLVSVGWACLLEEHRFYVREEYAVPGDAGTELAPRLSRARMNPGTEEPLDGLAANLRLDIADNIFDLQIALGFDSDYPSDGSAPGAFEDDADYLGTDDTVFEGTTAAARDADDWLYNSPGDDPAALQWRVHRFPGNSRGVALEYVRLTLLGRADRQDPSYRAPLLELIEDHEYDVAPSNAFNQEHARMYRRRMLQTVVAPRNL